MRPDIRISLRHDAMTQVEDERAAAQSSSSIARAAPAGRLAAPTGRPDPDCPEVRRGAARSRRAQSSGRVESSERPSAPLSSAKLAVAQASATRKEDHRDRRMRLLDPPNDLGQRPPGSTAELRRPAARRPRNRRSAPPRRRPRSAPRGRRRSPRPRGRSSCRTSSGSSKAQRLALARSPSRRRPRPCSRPASKARRQSRSEQRLSGSAARIRGITR